MAQFRFGVIAQLTTSFFVAVFFTMAAAGLGVYTIQTFNQGIKEVTLSHLPTLTLAYQLGQQSEAIVASAPNLVRVETQANRETVTFRIADRVRWLEELIRELQDTGVNPSVIQTIDATRAQLLANYDELNERVKERIAIDQLEAETAAQIRQIVRERLTPLSGTEREFNEVLRQLFLPPVTAAQFDGRYREVLELKFRELEANIIPAHLDIARTLKEVSLGPNGIVLLRENRARVKQQIDGILNINERISSRFVYSVNELIRTMRQEITNQTSGFQLLVDQRTTILTGIGAASLFAVGVMGLIFIRRTLKRLNALKNSMRSHAKGEKSEIPLEGQDEISDMGAALKFLVDEIDRREHDIRVNEERFRDVAEATSDWLWETNAELEYTMVTDRFYEITGFEPDEMLGRSRMTLSRMMELNSEEEEKWIEHELTMQKRQAFRDFSFTIRCPNARLRQIKVSGKPVFDDHGRFIGYRGTGADITAETQAKSRLTAANEIMPGAFALWDHDNKLMLCNRKFHQYYKLLGDIIQPGMTFETFVRVIQDRNVVLDSETYGARRLKFRQTPRGVFMESMRNGDFLQVSEAKTLDGGTVSLIVDITDRIKSESRMEKARTEAENANKAKSKFLAAASHDLRQPLHAIGMFLSALEDRRKKAGTENAEGDLSIIHNTSDSLEALRSLLNALLDISKLDAGVMKAEKRNVMLRPLMERLVTQYQGRAGEKGLKLKSFCPNWAVKSDPVLLERVMANLLSNAVRYTSDGGVLIGMRKRGSEISLEVWDTGTGIPKDKINEIFVEFQQLENPARDRRRGLGLGLAIVERVLALLDHPLNVKSVVGKGSVFSLSVPVGRVVEDAPSDDRPVEAVLTQGEAALIVVIDDEPDILEGMKQLILGWKYEVIAAASGDEAMQALKKCDKSPNLILADYRLKEEETGADVIRRIHDKYDTSIPAAIITGDTAPDRIQEAKASGFMLLHKPMRPGKLRQLIRSVQARVFPN